MLYNTTRFQLSYDFISLNMEASAPFTPNLLVSAKEILFFSDAWSKKDEILFFKELIEQVKAN